METKKASKILVVVLSLAFFALYGCGADSDILKKLTGGDGTTGGNTGGGGGGGGASTRSPGIAVGAVSGLISWSGMGLSTIAGPDELAPRFEKKGMKDAWAGFYANLMADRKAVKSKAPQTTNCQYGGTMTTERTETSFTQTFNHCVSGGSSPGVRSYQNGTMTWSETDSDNNGIPESFSKTAGSPGSPFTSRETRISDNRLLKEEIVIATVRGTFGTTTKRCGSSDKYFPDSVTITMNESSSTAHDSNADGTVDKKESNTLTNLTLVATASEFNNKCEPPNVTIRMSGGASRVDHIEPNESGSMRISDSNPILMTWEYVTGGEKITINGTFTGDTACFDGSITIATQTPLFIPDNSDCPTSGVTRVTGDMTATITYTSSGGVEIDEGSNGSVDQTLRTCNYAEFCI